MAECSGWSLIISVKSRHSVWVLHSLKKQPKPRPELNLQPRVGCTFQFFTINNCFYFFIFFSGLIRCTKSQLQTLTASWFHAVKSPHTCTALQSAQPRTQPGRGHILSGTAPAGVAPPVCGLPPGSERPRPLTQSSVPSSCCSGSQPWPQYSPRRSTPWASYWCHRGPPRSISPPYLLRCHHGWQTLLPRFQHPDWWNGSSILLCLLFLSFFFACYIYFKQKLLLSLKQNNKAVLF